MKVVRIMKVLFTVSLVLAFCGDVAAQSGREYRRSSYMKGNLVKTIFGNWAVIGQPAQKGLRGAWIYDNNGYVGDVSPLVGAEVVKGDTTFHSVVVCPVQRPTVANEVSPSGKQWGFEPVRGYFNEEGQDVALYGSPASWPPSWPDKMDDPEDPGWEESWNGYFGKTTTASEECYFVMDDNNDEEFNVAGNNRWKVNFKPDSRDPGRNGLGLEVKVRGMQWRQFLAQDCIFWLYEITNTGTTDYSKVVFGMLVGTYVGCTAGNDQGEEYNDDYSFFDVERDLTYTADFDDNCSRNPLWTDGVGVVGYAFLESPGNPFDGIDNDDDADGNPLYAATGPEFVTEDFDSTLIKPGDRIVLINDNYERTLVTVPPRDTTFRTRGKDIFVSPGVTKLAEGNILKRDVEFVNPNAYDGIDNDLDGLIDENYYLHYRQIRKDQDGNVLINILKPVRYVDYISGRGTNDLLIDERRDDGVDNDGDWNPEFDDVGSDGVLDTGDRGEGDGRPTAGEPNFDQTDVDESDQIGLTSFEYFAPSNAFSMADDEEMWGRLAPGFFEVPPSIINNKPQGGEDGDFIYGSAYFPLRAGQTERFSLALVYGEGGGPQVEIDDLLKNRETVQKIYNSDYRFPPAPEKPTLTAVPGDGKVTLYWDRKAEESLDPVLKVKDFEGYKIYRATDANFNDIFNITDADGTNQGYIPIAQFDLDNGITGYFRASDEMYQETRGFTFNLGDDSGLKHTYVDEDVENGRRYFYAIVAYDRGDQEQSIFPAENDFMIDISQSGDVTTRQNTAVVVPRAQVLGYVPPEGSEKLAKAPLVVGTGDVYYNVVDEPALTGHRYRLEFYDTSTDLVDNDDDWNSQTDDVGSDGDPAIIDTDGTQYNGKPDLGEPNLDVQDAEELMQRTTTFYSVLDSNGVTEAFLTNGTDYVRLKHTHLVNGTVTVWDETGETVPAVYYELDLVNGRIRGKESGTYFPLSARNVYYTISFQYYPIYKNKYIGGSPYVAETKDADIFDGLQFAFNNHWSVDRIDSLSGWKDPSKTYRVDFTVVDTEFPTGRLKGHRHPCDYEIQFFDGVADTTITEIGSIPPGLLPPATPVNFKVFNVTEQRYIDFLLVEVGAPGRISDKDELIFVEKGPNDSLVFTWDLTFVSTPSGVAHNFVTGDKYSLKVYKSFRQGDVFWVAPAKPNWDETTTEGQLDAIRVVPNPYVVATSHELPLPPGVTGRGPRQIQFRHLPPGAAIHIFTSRGEHVITLNHDSDIYDGTVDWNLKTKENLDISYGVYFYVVDSSVGTKRGKIAIIK